MLAPTGVGKEDAMRQRPTVKARLTRLREFVIAMIPGEQVNAKQAMAISGLERRLCDAMLESLVRHGFTIRLQHDAYIRRESASSPLL
jgi:hypothetical protein